MTVTRLWYHPFRKKDQAGPVSDLPDHDDMLDVFAAYVESGLDRERLVRTDTETYVSIEGKPERKGRSLTLAFESGRFGERGTIKDRRTHEVKGTFGRDDATAVVTHGVLLVPKIGTSALAFVERSAGQGGMTRVLDLFVETFNATYPNHRMEKESILRTEAWIKRAGVLQIRGTVRKRNSDPASDSKHLSVGDLVHTLVPSGGQTYLPRSVWHQFRDNKLERARYLGLSDETDLDNLDLEVTLGDGDQQRTFEIDTQKTPSLRLVITGSGQTPFTAGRFRKEALDQAKDIFDEYGIDWSEADALDRSSAK